MSISGEAMRFEMLSGSGSQPSSREAVMNVCRAQSQHAHSQHGWKAYISLSLANRSNRLFGAWRSTIVEAVDSLLQKHSHRIAQTEVRRVLEGAAAMQARRTANLCTSVSGYLPRSASETTLLTVTALGRPSCARIQALRRETCVHYVHQMYGLFGDDKPMSDLFQTSQRMWSEVAAGMGAKYHLWSAASVESLIKQRYPQYWDMYCGVRYPIMRCDIGRIAIIHSYGGLYADLDTQPNRVWYEQVDLALARVKVPRDKSGTVKATRLSTKKEQSSVECTMFLEMEVIIGSAENAVFLDWIEYIREQIACKPYTDNSSFWHTARMRYVFHTTGPYGMNRFLKLPVNAAKLERMKFVECNWFKDAEALNENRKRVFDVISYQSQSYFTKEHEIRVPVGLGDKALPPLPTTKRMRVKSKVRRMGVSNVDKDGVQLPAMLAVQAPSQDNHAGPSEASAVAFVDAEGDSKMDSVADAVVNCLTDLVTELLLDSMIAAVMHLEGASRQDRYRMNQMKAHFQGYYNCVATKVTLEDMPHELRQWITSDPIHH